MFITITRTGLCRIGVGLSIFAVLTAVFILFPRENAEPTAVEQAVPASVSDWGLSFQTEGQPPVGNVSAEELRQYNAFYVGDTSQKTIYLTFDAGYENGCTPAILDALKKHNAPACFFVVGNFIDTAPELVKRMAAEGHIVGNHTHAAGQTVYDKLAIVIQSKNPYHPYIELDFSNHTAVFEMWKSLQTSSILENIFETETKFSISYAGCDTDIKIRKRFSAIPSLPFALTSIGPAQLNMLNQTLLHLEAIAQADSSNSAPVL